MRSSYKYIGSIIDYVKINKNFFWNVNDKRYFLIDSIFSELLSVKKQGELTIYVCRKIGEEKTFLVVNKGEFYSHGNDLHSAVSDLEFKIASDKLKNEPINEDTIVTVKYYRLITGACEFGVKEWMKKNNITKDEILAKDLLKLLEKTNAYGLEKFKKLLTF